MMLKIIKLTTLSPVHIGAGNELTPMEFVILDNMCYVINEDRFLNYLEEKGKIDEFIKEASSGRLNLFSYLKDIDLSELEKVSSYSVSLPNDIDTSKINKIRPFIRNAYSQPYIPGTSIKGAIRTAVMWNILNWLKSNKNDQFKEKVIQFIEEKLNLYENWPPKKQRREKDKFKKTFFSRGNPGLLELIFQRFLLEGADYYDEKGRWRHKYDAPTDILRAIKVSDTEPLGKNDLRLERVEVLSSSGRISKPTHPEVIPEKTKLEFTLKIDEDILGDFLEKNRNNKDTLIPFDEIEKIIRYPLQATKRFTDELIKEDESYFESSGLASFLSTVKSEGPNFRLGWGSGLLGTTLATLLGEPLLQRLRNLLFVDKDGAVAPKTRRMIVKENRPYQPLGWVKLEVKEG